MKIAFHGADRTVTGSKHLLKLENGKRILLDCGMFQGRGKETDELNRDFGFNPREVDCMILSHAHIDHSGLIPRLVKQGFKGPIYCTPATYDLCTIMLLDSAHIQEDDAYYLNLKLGDRLKRPIEPLYTINDVPPSLELFVPVKYNTKFNVYDDVELLFTDSGHILGAAAVNLTVTENGQKTHITFTGDIGRYNNRILKQPAPFPQADYIITESTYGDRIHPPMEEVDEVLLQVVLETCVNKKGKLLIPAFSVGRTQEIVNVLDTLNFKGLLPNIKVYVDSPLSTNATEIVGKHTECFNQQFLDNMKKDPTPFGFNNLHYIKDVNESKALNNHKEPCIIISASGMAEAGRIKHHIKNNIEDPRNTILLVGWCTPSSLGGRLKDGAEKVKIFGEELDVNADVISLEPFSAHGDYQEMLRYLSCQDPSKVKGVFLVHGDEDVMPKWRNRLADKGFRHIEIPEKGEIYHLD